MALEDLEMEDVRGGGGRGVTTQLTRQQEEEEEGGAPGLRCHLQPPPLTHWDQARQHCLKSCNLTISQSHNLTISQSYVQSYVQSHKEQSILGLIGISFVLSKCFILFLQSDSQAQEHWESGRQQNGHH